jgi:surface antigen
VNSVDHLIAIAAKEKGYHEGPENLTKYGKWYDPRFKHVAWCDMFVSWCANQAGLSKVVGRYALCRDHANWFQAHGRWGAKPRRGAIVFFHMPGGHDGINHVGIVAEVLADGGVVTWEGNSGDRVAKVVRRAHRVGYGYPAYPDHPAITSPPPPAKVPAFPLPAGWSYGPASAAHSVTGHSGPASYRAGLKTWQQRMLTRGWSGIGTADGYYTDRTAKVARQFQKEKHLHIDGGIGPETWRAAWTTKITG